MTLKRSKVFLHTMKLKSEKDKTKTSAKELGFELKKTHWNWRPLGTEKLGDDGQHRDPEKCVPEHPQGQLIIHFLRGDMQRITNSSILVAKMSTQLLRLNAPLQP
jgi:hypothetical protein